MWIIETKDENFPIKFDDTWGEGAYLDSDTVLNDKEWKAFIAELEAVRAKIKKKA